MPASWGRRRPNQAESVGADGVVSTVDRSSLVQQRERGDGVHDVLAVLLDVNVADREVLAAGAHLRGDRQRTGRAGSQIRDGELAGRRHVLVVGRAADGQPHRRVHQRREDAAVQGARRVQVLVGRLDPDRGPPVRRLFGPGAQSFRVATCRCVVCHGRSPTRIDSVVDVIPETLSWWEDGERHLATAVGRLVDEDLARPSLLPGWDRAHVLAHVANNADALINLLTWARTGVETPMYASQEARDAGIEETSK